MGGVSGRVTFKDQPVTEGQVVFFSVDTPDMPDMHVYQSARIQSDGTYSVRMSGGPGLVTGKYEVAVMPPVVEPAGSNAPGPHTPRDYPDIPPRYRSPKTSQLTLEVKEGKNPPYDINMTP